MIDSRKKGASGELEWRDVLRANHNCHDAHRGCQHSGGPDSPDVAKGIPGTHAEVKRRKKSAVYSFVEQAVKECGGATPYVALRADRKPWLWIVRDEDILELAQKIVAQHERDAT